MKLSLWSLLLLWMYSIVVLEWETISYKFDSAPFLIFQASVALLWVRPVRPVYRTSQTGLFRDSFPRTPCRKKLETISTLVSEVRTSIALYLHYLHTILTLTWFYDDLDIFFDKYGATFFMYETTSSLKENVSLKNVDCKVISP